MEVKSPGFFFFKQKTAYEFTTRLVGWEMCIRDRPLFFQQANTLPAQNLSQFSRTAMLAQLEIRKDFGQRPVSYTHLTLPTNSRE